MKSPIIAAAFMLFTPIHADIVLPVTQFTTDLDSFNIDVATDNHNNAIALYQDGFIGVFASYSANGGIWGPPVPLSSDSIRGAISLAMDESGTALAAWLSGGVETAFFNNGMWNSPSPTPLDASPGGYRGVGLAMNGSGKGLAVWCKGSDGFASFFSGGVWTTPPTPIASGDMNNDIQVAYSPNGTAAVLSSASFVFPSTVINALNYDGTWHDFGALDSDAESPPSLGIDASGNASGVWLSGANPDVVTSRFDGTSWSSLHTLSTGINNSPPSVAVASAGTAVAVWVDGTFNVQMSLFNGASWSAPIFVAANAQNDTGSGLTTPSGVTMDSSGNALLIWPSANNQVMGALLPVGGVLETPIVIENASSPSIGSPNVALSDDATVGWAVWNENGLEISNTFGTSILFSPDPPTNAAGSVCVNKFVAQTDRINVITWTPSTDTTATYEIRRNGTLIGTVPSTGPFTYLDHNRCKCVTYIYAITAINSLGVSSIPALVTIPYPIFKRRIL